MLSKTAAFWAAVFMWGLDKVVEICSLIKEARSFYFCPDFFLREIPNVMDLKKRVLVRKPSGIWLKNNLFVFSFGV